MQIPLNGQRSKGQKFIYDNKLSCCLVMLVLIEPDITVESGKRNDGYVKATNGAY